MAELPKPKLDSLTGLRFFLAIFVFFYHGVTQAHLGLGKNSLSPEVITFIDYSSNGGLAVGCFFLLSGFVLWYSYSGRNWSFSEFIFMFSTFPIVPFTLCYKNIYRICK